MLDFLFQGDKEAVEEYSEALEEVLVKFIYLYLWLLHWLTNYYCYYIITFIVFELRKWAFLKKELNFSQLFKEYLKLSHLIFF